VGLIFHIPQFRRVDVARCPACKKNAPCEAHESLARDMGRVPTTREAGYPSPARRQEAVAMTVGAGVQIPADAGPRKSEADSRDWPWRWRRMMKWGIALFLLEVAARFRTCAMRPGVVGSAADHYRPSAPNRLRDGPRSRSRGGPSGRIPERVPTPTGFRPVKEGGRLSFYHAVAAR